MVFIADKIDLKKIKYFLCKKYELRIYFCEYYCR